MAIYTGVPPQGKKLGTNKDGNPAWVDIPQLSTQQLVAIAQQKKAKLRSIADAEISWRQYAVDRSKATAEEAAA